jgi:hypothetical protein
MNSPLLVLNLAIEYVLYSSSSIARMRSTLCTPLQGGEEKYTAYPPFLLAIYYMAYSLTSCISWRERSSRECTSPLLIVVEYIEYSSSSQLRMRSTTSTTLQD